MDKNMEPLPTELGISVLGGNGFIRLVARLTLLTALVLLMAGVLVWGTPLNPDCALFLEFGGLILGGAVPYVDYADINPPITHYLHAVPVWLAGIFGEKIATLFHIMVLLLVMYSAILLWILSARSPAAFSIPARLFVIAAWVTFSILVLHRGQFGQREHLFMLSYIPWLSCRHLHYSGGEISKGIGVVTGLMAAPFVLMKPLFCLIVGALEAWMLFRSRRPSCLYSSEVLAALGVVAIYGLHFLYLPHSMTDQLASRWVPLAAENYFLPGYPTKELLWTWVSVRDMTGRFLPTALIVPLAIVLSLLMLVLRSKMPKGRRLELRVFAAGTLISVCVYFVQQLGWSLHLVPTTGFASLFLATFAVTFPDTAKTKGDCVTWYADGLRVAAFTGLCATLAVLAVLMVIKGFNPQQGPTVTERFVDLIKRHTNSDDRVAFISTQVTPAYPALIEAGRSPGTRYPFAFPMALLYKGITATPSGTFPYRKEADFTDEERIFLSELGSDIVRYKPRLVIIDDEEHMTYAPIHARHSPKGFRAHEYLRQTEWIRKFLCNYKELTHLGGHVVYLRNP